MQSKCDLKINLPLEIRIATICFESVLAELIENCKLKINLPLEIRIATISFECVLAYLSEKY